MNIYRNKQNRWYNIYYDSCYPDDGERVLVCCDDEVEEYEVATYYAVDPKCDIEWVGSGFYRYNEEDWQERVRALAWMHISPYKEMTHCFEDCDDYLGICKDCMFGVVDMSRCPYNGQAFIPKIEDPVEYYAAMLDFAKKQRDDGVWFMHEE